MAAANAGFEARRLVAATVMLVRQADLLNNFLNIQSYISQKFINRVEMYPGRNDYVKSHDNDLVPPLRVNN